MTSDHRTMQVAGIVGWTLAHSRSPLVHGHWLHEHGIDGAYVKLPVRPGSLDVALRGMAALGMRGCNVTVPHKEMAATIVDRLSARARAIGAANLVTVAEDGTLDGDNTDAAGFIGSLRDADPDWHAGRGPAVVVGAGGAARAVAWALLDAGVPSLRLVNRTAARARELSFGAIDVVEWDDRARALEGAALLVNTTVAGMAGNEPLDLDLALLPRDALVSDVVYVPAMTPLLIAARARGNRIAPGLPMLLHQAAPAFYALFGVRPTVTPELRALVQNSL